MVQSDLLIDNLEKLFYTAIAGEIREKSSGNHILKTK